MNGTPHIDGNTNQPLTFINLFVLENGISVRDEVGHKNLDWDGGKAKEVVITNTNKIADMIEKISPVHPDKCPPVIPKSDETLNNICYDKRMRFMDQIFRIS